MVWADTPASLQQPWCLVCMTHMYAVVTNVNTYLYCAVLMVQGSSPHFQTVIAVAALSVPVQTSQLFGTAESIIYEGTHVHYIIMTPLLSYLDHKSQKCIKRTCTCDSTVYLVTAVNKQLKTLSRSRAIAQYCAAAAIKSHFLSNH